jgi:1-deoxy-D-xylulose-5-phosphate reductoisomerase
VTLGVALLGATGSVGGSVVRVVRQHPDRLRIVALAAYGSDPEGLVALARELSPRLLAVADPEAARQLEGRLPRGVELAAGDEGVCAAACHPEASRVVAAMVGAAGLAPAYRALEAGKDLALANKEALVVAGPLLMALARRRGALVLPVDSEHAALHQALRCGRHEELRRLVLTASGGPFWRREAASLASVRPEEALQHPTWKMGAKITVDSATLMNKGLELIEASHLFAVAAERIEVVIHPQSILHSMAEFRDGSWMAQMSVNDMVFPVQYALSYPDRWANDFPRLEPARLGALELHPLEEEKFPSVGLARAALAAGETAPAVLNAANEVAVEAFLAHQLPFPGIASTVAAVLEEHHPEPLGSLEAALEWDRWGRRRATELLARA